LHATGGRVRSKRARRSPRRNADELSTHHRRPARDCGTRAVTARGLFVLLPTDAGHGGVPRLWESGERRSRSFPEIQLAAAAAGVGLFLCEGQLPASTVRRAVDLTAI